MLLRSVCRAALILSAASGLPACGDDHEEVGAPCETDDDCGGDLKCDVHDGKGTCQGHSD